MKKKLRVILQVWVILAGASFALSLGLYTNEVNSAAEDSSASTGGTVGRGGSCTPNDGVIECQSGFCCICGKYEDGSPIGNRCSGAGEGCSTYCTAEYNSRANASIACGTSACNKNVGCCRYNGNLCANSSKCQAPGQLESDCLTDPRFNGEACTNTSLKGSAGTCKIQGQEFNCCPAEKELVRVSGSALCVDNSTPGQLESSCNNAQYNPNACTSASSTLEGQVPGTCTFQGQEFICCPAGEELVRNGTTARCVTPGGDNDDDNNNIEDDTEANVEEDPAINIEDDNGADFDIEEDLDADNATYVDFNPNPTAPTANYSFGIGRGGFTCGLNVDTSQQKLTQDTRAEFISSSRDIDFLYCPGNINEPIDATVSKYTTDSSCSQDDTFFVVTCAPIDLSTDVVGVDKRGDEDFVATIVEPVEETEEAVLPALNVSVPKDPETEEVCLRTESRPRRVDLTTAGPVSVDDLENSIRSSIVVSDDVTISFNGCSNPFDGSYTVSYTRYINGENNFCRESEGDAITINNAVQGDIVNVTCSDLVVDEPQEDVLFPLTPVGSDCTQTEELTISVEKTGGLVSFSADVRNRLSLPNDFPLTISSACTEEYRGPVEVTYILYKYANGFCRFYSKNPNTGDYTDTSLNAADSVTVRCRVPGSSDNSINQSIQNEVFASNARVLGVSTNNQLSTTDSIVFQSTILDLYLKSSDGLPASGTVQSEIQEYVTTGSKQNLSPAIRSFVETMVEKNSCYGDLDNDGEVDLLDLARYAKIYDNVAQNDGRLVSLSQFALNYNREEASCNYFFDVTPKL